MTDHSLLRYHSWVPFLLASLVVLAALIGHAPGAAGHTPPVTLLHHLDKFALRREPAPAVLYLPLTVTSAPVPAPVPVGKFGIDPLHPIDIHQGTLTPISARPETVAATGADWVRLNFVLGPWQAVDDPTQYHGQTWVETYRDIVAGYRRAGLGIYGLISYEAMPADPGESLRRAPPPGAGGTPWIDDYVATLVRILHLFGADLHAVETLNEPDDWHGGATHWIHPGWFAILQQRVYTAVKSDPALAHITLVSGPLQGFSNNHNAAAGYLLRVYWEGKTRFGWGTDGVPYPFDGIGYHLYLDDRYFLDPAAQTAAVAARYRRYIAEMQAVIQEAEGGPRPLYLSEIGFTSRAGDEQRQADNLHTVLTLVEEDPNVALGVWFALQDFPQASRMLTYGLYRAGELGPANRKPAYAAYHALAAGERLY